MSFDDLLIGNFMKTTLHKMSSLYDGDFNFAVTKFGDNGRVKTHREIDAYLNEYRGRAGRRLVLSSALRKSARPRSVFGDRLSAARIASVACCLPGLSDAGRLPALKSPQQISQISLLGVPPHNAELQARAVCSRRRAL